MSKELHDPLMPRGRRVGHKAPSFSALRIATIALVCLMLGGFSWLILAHDPNGGMPRVVATIEKGDPITTGSITPKTAPPSNTITAHQAGDATSPADSGRSVGPGGAARVEQQIASLAAAASGLIKAPLPHLVEESRYGLLPRRSETETPALAYARPLSRDQAQSDAPRVVLIISGLGLNPRMSELAIDQLPPDVTVAVSAESANAQDWIDRARQDGHEVLLQVPMEARDQAANREAARPLLASASPDELTDQLHWQLSRATGYFGIVNQAGNQFTTDIGGMTVLLGELKQRGLAFVEAGTGSSSLGASLAKAAQLDYAKANVVISAGLSPEAVDAALDELVEMAKRDGLAIGTASALPTVLQKIGPWIDELEKEGLILVPASSALTFLDR